jgi:hypothetical protein
VKPKKKSGSKLRQKSVSGRKWARAEWVCIGVDVSLSSISLGGIAKTTEKKIRTGAVSLRWSKETDYFQRLKSAAYAHDIVHDLLAEMAVMAEPEQIAFAVEEAVPIGMLQRGTKGKSSGATGAWMKQQIQISGAFLGGLVRYGFPDIIEIQANQWQALVAKDLGITTHGSKWKNPDFLALPEGFHTSSGNTGKYRAQQWIMKFHPKWDGHWPDIVKGLPRDTSKAQGDQSDDRYEALAMAEWLRQELKRLG